MSRILFLGAAHFQVPAIQYAVSQGHHVITVDNNEESPGHVFSQESYIVSTTDKHSILKLAKKLNIDSVLSFGSDVAVPTAAYISSNLGLSGITEKSAEILTNKEKFRNFLNETGIQQQRFKCFSDSQNLMDFLLGAKEKMIVKPIDSSGSKGVFLFDARKIDESTVKSRVKEAFSFSMSQRVVVESFIDQVGPQVCGDGYYENGKIRFVAYGDGYFKKSLGNYTPYGESFPSSHSEDFLNKVTSKIEEILQSLKVNKIIFNLDVLNNNGVPFIVELGPRSGGNMIPVAIREWTGVNMIEMAIENALGKGYPIGKREKEKGAVAIYMLHLNEGKIVNDVFFSDFLKEKIVKYTPYFSKGDFVPPFSNARTVVGNIIMKFSDKESMLETMGIIENHIRYV